MPQVRYGPGFEQRRPRGRRPRLPTTVDREWLVARHEAGHAVVALALGCRVTTVMVGDDGRGNDGYAFVYSGDPAVSLAGVLAGRRAARELYVHGGLEGQGLDLADALNSCIYTYGSDWRQAFTEAKRRARRILCQRWPEVRVLASRLLREGIVYEPILPALA